MSIPAPLLTRSIPGRAMLRLARTEAKLFLREPMAVFWALAFPVVLLVVIGSFKSDRQPSHDFGGLAFIDVYIPVLIAFVLSLIALNAVPTILASYREKGVLRRLATTPTPPWVVLIAQLAVNLAAAVAGLILILAVGRLAFGVGLPVQVAGFVLPSALPLRPSSPSACWWRRWPPPGAPLV